MAIKLVAAITYSYNFREIIPLVDIKMLFFPEDIIKFFVGREMIEEHTKKQGAAEIIAEAKTKEAEGTKTIAETKDETRSQQTYILTYYNPETNTVEKLATTNNVTIKDETQKKIEEAVGTHSGYSLYSMIAAPLIYTVVDPHLLEKILNEREYSTPPDYHGPTKIKVSDQHTTAEIIAITQQEKAKEAFVETLQRKEKVESKIVQEIVVLEEVVKTLRKDETAEKALEKLPPLTRARFIAALRKKQLSRTVIILLLEKDISFLKEIKKKLGSLSLQDLIKLVDTMSALARGK